MFRHGLAIFAGVCGAMASFCAKLAFNPETVVVMCTTCMKWITKEHGDICKKESITIWSTQILLFGLLFVFNGLMWTLFVKSTQKCDNTMEATVINTAANFFISGVMGWLIFEETLSLLWWLGATHILFGILLIHHSSGNVPIKTE